MSNASIYMYLRESSHLAQFYPFCALQTRYKNLNLARKLQPEVMERLYLKDDSALVPSSPSPKMPASIKEGKSVSGKEAGATKSSKQKQDKETIPEIPTRTKREVNISSCAGT